MVMDRSKFDAEGGVEGGCEDLDRKPSPQNPTVKAPSTRCYRSKSPAIHTEFRKTTGRSHTLMSSETHPPPTHDASDGREPRIPDVSSDLPRPCVCPLETGVQ